jgi:hypothetical protein
VLAPARTRINENPAAATYSHCVSLIEPDPYDAWLLFKHLFEERQGVVSTEYHAMAIRAGLSGVPEDVFVNNFTFLADDDKVTAADDITAALVDFYDTPGPTRAINAYRSRALADLMTFKIYKLSDLKPREPLIRTHTTTVAKASTQVIPEEVAICLSFSAAAPHTPRRRGRIYIGPLTAVACVEEDVTGCCRITNAAQADISAAAVRLANHVDAGWLIHSMVGAGTFAAVETGWVDNAFDTQRKRGCKSTNRYTWAKS